MDKEKVGDLIYCGDEDYEECKNQLLSKWPHAVINDASDYIHGGRFEIEVNENKDIFWLFLLNEGYYGISLGLGLLARTNLVYLKGLLSDKR